MGGMAYWERHIAEALQIPYEPSHFDDFRVWTSPTELEMVHILSRGASTPLDSKERSPVRSLFKMSEGFSSALIINFGSPSLFRREGTQKEVQRADTILFSFQGCCAKFWSTWGILLSLSWSASAFAERAPQPAARRASPRHIPEGIPIAAPAIPKAPPVTPASSQPSTSAEPRMAIPISEYRELCRSLETLTASQSSLAQEMAAIRACQEQMLATQAQHTAILRQLQLHFDLPPAVEPSTLLQCHTLIHRASGPIWSTN
ncbi:hypothetical protein CK203_065435 [Vitis vinifera]|uniref:Uncharacterized protein n=1 Tax=Vitis vinifera TaxID=29760 RepID=A0A438FP66_VITVI|nr:hypothetical protein CK203_065435 [Vitis vinifera]